MNFYRMILIVAILLNSDIINLNICKLKFELNN